MSRTVAGTTRAALYVDFDNAFLALAQMDERAAFAFADRPEAWLDWLEAPDGALDRRTLIRRCYLNPGGSFDFRYGEEVADHRAHRGQRSRAYFGEFRAAFVRAGFDVVDCPPVTALKNSADMKMALDIREALDHRTPFEEFILLSGDSDFLPALIRLRAHDRRITILAQDNAKAAYLAAADVVVGLRDFADQGMGDHPVARPAPPVPAPAPRAQPATLRAAALDFVRGTIAGSERGGVRLADLGNAMLRAIPALRGTDYAGAGSLVALVRDAGDPGLVVRGVPPNLWLLDPGRAAGADGVERATAPPPVVPASRDDARGPGVPDPESAWAPQAPDEVPAREEGAGRAPAKMPPTAAPPIAVPPDVPPPDMEPPDVELAIPERAVPGSALVEPPSAEPAVAPPVDAEPTNPEGAKHEAARLVRDLLWGHRDARNLPQDLPAFLPAEITAIRVALAARRPLPPDAHADAAREVAADLAAAGLHVSAREVTAVIRWLCRGPGGVTALARPGGPDDLGRILFDAVIAALDMAREGLSDVERADLLGWTGGDPRAG